MFANTTAIESETQVSRRSCFTVKSPTTRLQMNFLGDSIQTPTRKITSIHRQLPI